METIPSIAAGQNQVIGTGLIYGDDYTYSFTPTLTKIFGHHTLKAGANLLMAEVNYFQNNNTGGTFTFSNAPTALDGTNPGATGDPFASFLIGQPDRRHLPVIEFHLRPLALPGLLRRGFLAGELTTDREPRAPPGDARVRTPRRTTASRPSTPTSSTRC